MESIEPYNEHTSNDSRIVAEGEWGSDIQQRTFNYALRIIRLYRYLKDLRDDVGIIIGKQLLRAGTSVGANVAEARSAQSRPDYAHKLSIALKELRESSYWLQLLEQSQIVESTRIKDLGNETDPLIAVSTSIIVKLKQKR